MDFKGSEEESNSLVDSWRQDVEELITLLDNYKLEIENKCDAKSLEPLGAVDSEEVIARAALVEKMVLIKRKSLAQLPVNGCTSNRLDDEDDEDTSDEDDAEREGLVSKSTSPEDSEEVYNSACSSSIGGIKVSDLDELITLLNECLDDNEGKDVVDHRRASPCSKLKRRLTVIEDLVEEKRKSIHCLAPTSGCGAVTIQGFLTDTFGFTRKLVSIKKLAKKHPKTMTADNWAVDFKQTTTCPKLKRKLTVVEEMLMEKRNSSHCLVPKSCSGDVCNVDYIRDKFGICRKIISIARIGRHPKTKAAKKSLIDG